MAEVDSAAALFVEALQDLADAERALAERGPGVARAVCDDALQAMVIANGNAAAANVARLESMLADLDAPAHGADNIWLRAILDDADRDAATVARGVWRDVALTGALRKGKQAQRVSYETAIALAYYEQQDAAAIALSDLRDACEALDDAFAERLAAFTDSDLPD
jgi:ferritin-like metal-binding protein YciE